MHHLYILYSPNLDKYYIGSTSISIDERIQKHLSNHDGFTSKAKDWILVYQEVYPELSVARSRELQIKKWKSRKAITKLINDRSM